MYWRETFLGLARLDPMHLVGAFAALDVLWMV
jgi:hypothetical protein